MVMLKTAILTGSNLYKFTKTDDTLTVYQGEPNERVKLLQQQYVTLCWRLEFDLAFNLIINNGE